MKNEPIDQRIALAVSTSLKQRVDEWRRRQPQIPSWTASARFLLETGLQVEEERHAQTASRVGKLKAAPKRQKTG